MVYVTPVLDTFNRTNEGPPMTGWADIVNGLKVISNVCGGNAAGSNLSYWSGFQTNADCEVGCKITTMPGNNNAITVYARLKDVGSSATYDGYALAAVQLTGTDTFRVYRVDNGAVTQLGADLSQAFAINDEFKMVIVGSTIEVWYASGGANWTLKGTRTDSTYAAGGYLGASINTTTGRLDDFRGGNYITPQQIALRPRLLHRLPYLRM